MRGRSRCRRKGVWRRGHARVEPDRLRVLSAGGPRADRDTDRRHGWLVHHCRIRPQTAGRDVSRQATLVEHVATLEANKSRVKIWSTVWLLVRNAWGF